MRTLSAQELSVVSGGASAAIPGAEHGKKLGWCIGLGNIGESAGGGEGLVGGGKTPPHKGQDCACGCDDGGAV